MSDDSTTTWTGQSGTGYEYWIFPISTKFSAVAGNYIFAKEKSRNSFEPIYVGETLDLSARPENHRKQSCVSENGATHIHVHHNTKGVDARRAEAADIVAKWDPPCNR
jgi:hypothetical protein